MAEKILDGGALAPATHQALEEDVRHLPGEALARDRRHFICQHDNGSTWLTGFSRMPEPGHPEIAWYVVVEHLLEEAQASTRGATVYLLLFFGAMVLAGMILISEKGRIRE